MFKLLVFLFMLLFAGVYFIPSFVAIGRKHVHVLQITILNTFLGWSFIAWVAALIWATLEHTDEKAKTKTSWIIIGIFFLLLASPLLLYSIIPSKYKSSVIQETQYKKIIYTNNAGKVINEETKTEHTEKD